MTSSEPTRTAPDEASGPAPSPAPQGDLQATSAEAPSRRFPAASPVAALEGRFEVLGLLGRGGMGAVYRARDRASGREVALKVVLDGQLDARRRARLEREGQLTAALDHPGIVRIHAAGEEGGIPYLAYELVEDVRTLGQLAPDLDLRARVGYVRDAARALAHAHERGVVHRDVKPDNLLVGRDGRLRVADFGLAAAQGLERLTRTGGVVGTPAFMAPEQITGGECGPAADVWALGVVLYLCVTDHLPFAAEDRVHLALRIVAADLTPPRALAPDLDDDLEAVILRALSVDVGARYASCTQLASDLQRWLDGLPVSVRARRPGWRRLAGGGAALALGVALACAATRATSPDARARPASSDRAPPALRIETAGAGVTWEPALVVRGTVADASGDVALRVIAGGVVVEARARGAFALEVPLPAGAAAVQVEARDRAGNVARALLGWTRPPAPAWLLALPPASRPPAPLPAALGFGLAPGEYRARDGSVLVWVPPATFDMGAPDGDPNERPVHTVRITRGVFMGRDEVTCAAFERFARERGRAAPERVEGSGDEHPAQGVSWALAREYCAWAGLRLPTEAEWELAARGVDGRPFPWGWSKPDRTRCNMAGADDGFATTSPAGAFPRGASPYGCRDMLGNAWEWVQDAFDHSYRPGLAVDPLFEGEWARVQRGGAYTSSPGLHLRATARTGRADTPGLSGFRVACSP